MHFIVGDIATALQPIPHGAAMPAAALQGYPTALGQHPRNVVGKPAPGNVREAVHIDLLSELQHRLDIDSCRHEQLLEQRLTGDRGAGVCPCDLDQLADKRVPVRVRTR